MKVSSFDVFDTCLVRKCGTPAAFFDILSTLVFMHPVSEFERQEFVIQRKEAERIVCENYPKANIDDIYHQFNYNNPELLCKEELKRIELSLENEMILPVLKTRDLVIRKRSAGHHIVFISDMYLPTAFIKSLLKKFGFWDDSDSIYVSCDYGCSKDSGLLYEIVCKKEKINKKQWKHYGDNDISDIIKARERGIDAHLIRLQYSIYGNKWRERSTIPSFGFSEILAGISRSMIVSEPDNLRKKFIIDIIAPLYSSFLYNIFYDAEENGIECLYFCARDTYQLYMMARIVGKQFPNIETKYFYISRDALYSGNEKAQIKYFEQIELASTSRRSAIVDTSSSGKTLSVLNEMLLKYGYQPVASYTISNQESLKHNVKIDPDKQHYVIRDYYLKLTPIYNNLFYYISIIENFFSTNTQLHTSGYNIVEGEAVPVLTNKVGGEDTVQDNAEYWSKIYSETLQKYAEYYQECNLGPSSKAIIESIAIPTLVEFFAYPERTYLPALSGCYGYSHKQKRFILYVKKESVLNLIRFRGKDTWWPRGTVILSLPNCLAKIFVNRLKRGTFHPSLSC